MEELLKSYAEKATESLRKVKDSESKHNLEELVSFTEFKA
jgi:geranylgeranyl pyrophosphate synthase